MKKFLPLLTYSILRLLVFIIPFALMMLLPIFREQYWLAAIFAALIGVSLSIIFLRRPIQGDPAPAPQPQRKRDDDAYEDDVIDADETSATPR